MPAKNEQIELASLCPVPQISSSPRLTSCLARVYVRVRVFNDEDHTFASRR